MTASGDVSLGRCPACGAVSRERFGERGDVHLVRCSACRLIYADPQPRGRVARRYLEEYDLAAHFERFRERKSVLFERRFAWLPTPRPGADRICDVGCADGQFLSLAQERGWEPFGVELNPAAAERARSRGITVHEGFFEEAEGLPWGTFDLVCLWDCIEHTPEPVEFVRRAVRLLRAGGFLALTTLNTRSLAARVFGIRWSMVVIDHFTYWDEGSLRVLLAAQGLEVGEVHTFGLGRDFVAWADRLRSRGGDQTEQDSSAEWDARSSVVRVEAVANRVLDRFDLGVGVAMGARRPR